MNERMETMSTENSQTLGKRSRFQKSMEQERVVAAAIRFQGEVFLGRTHGQAVLAMEKKYPRWQQMTDQPVEEGFSTTVGRFVDRQEADVIATAAAQVEEEARLHRVNSDELDSSHLI